MVNRIFKAAFIVGFGVLIAAFSVLLTHFLYPLFEESFFPDRINREKSLRKNIENKNQQVIYAGVKLNDELNIQEQQSQNFDDLSNRKLLLVNDLSNKQDQIQSHHHQLHQKEIQLQQKMELNKQQALEIESLESSLDKKQSSVRYQKQESQKIQDEIDELWRKMSLGDEEVLTPKSMGMNLFDINVREIEWKSFSGGLASFEATMSDSSKIKFNAKKDNFPDNEKRVEEFRKKGINFKLPREFNTWNKEVEVGLFEITYKTPQVGTTKPSQAPKKIRIGEYFKEQYIGEAFRVLLAIKELETLNVLFDPGKKLFEFVPFDSFKSQYFSNDYLLWNKLKDEQGNISITTSIFKTVDDLIRFWLVKTLDLVRTNTVDLVDVLHPILKTKSYSPAKKNN